MEKQGAIRSGWTEPPAERPQAVKTASCAEEAARRLDADATKRLAAAAAKSDRTEG